MKALVDDFVAVLHTLKIVEPVHLVGHDWGAIQGWEIASNLQSRHYVRSYTSISGPCLDHIAVWARQNPLHPAKLAQLVKSLYVGVLQIDPLVQVIWDHIMPLTWPQTMRRSEGPDAPTILVDDKAKRNGKVGARLYQHNIRQRMRNPSPPQLTLPVHLVIPLRDLFVSSAMARCAEPWCDDLTTTEIDAGHWCVAHKPDEVASTIHEFIRTR